MKKRVIVTIVLVVILCCAAAAHATLSGDIEDILAFKKGVSSDDAAAEIKSWGSLYDLATNTSGSGQGHSQRVLQGVHGEFWIGGYQDGSNKQSWVMGEPWSYRILTKGEPNDYYVLESEQLPAIWSRHGNHTCDPDPVVPIPGAVWLLGSGLAMLGGVRLVKGKVF